MILYHYSNKKNLNKISPAFFGTNNFTSTDCRKCNTKRTYFYISKNDREDFFKNDYLYIGIINDKKIYNLIDDKLNLKNKYINIDDIILNIKKRRFKGIIFDNGYFKTVCLFINLKVKMEA